MASEQVLEFTAANFDSDVLNADKPVLVDFWAEWCSPCKALAPTIDAVADAVGDRFAVGKMNMDGEGIQTIAANYGIAAIPTILIFKGGEVTKRFVGGNISKEDLEEALQASL